MVAPLLSTKLHIPTAGPHLVPRRALVERLEAGLSRRLTLVAAPAGFGKTTLISEWVAWRGRPVCWLSLDEGDDEACRFLAYVVAAIRSVWEGFGEAALAALQAPQLPEVQPILVNMINEMTDLAMAAYPAERSIVLVLDDYHLIADPAIHSAVAFMVEHSHPFLHMVIASRNDPPLPLARWRGRGQLAELRAVDLRFNSQEATSFLNETMALGLSTEDVVALENRTEGWIVGLQLAALSLPGAGDASRFIQGFTGSHRFVLDYLMEEVLQRQPAEVRNFLLGTALLDRLSGPLCDAVLERDDSRLMLERLEAANLFVVPLDHERRWYRYHRLFSDLLRVRLGEVGADRVETLHRRSCRWYQQQGMTTESLHHAMAAGDLDLAGKLVEQAAWQLFIKGEVRTVQGWLKTLGEEQVRRRPWLSILRAWTLLVEGRVSGLEGRLRDAERAVTPDIAPAERREMVGHMAVLRAYLSVLEGRAQEALEFARLAGEQLPEDNLQLRSTLAYTTSMACLLLGDLKGAMEAFARSTAQGRASGNVHLAVPALSALAGLLTVTGRLRQAAETYRAALGLATEMAGPHSPLAARVHSANAVLEYEWNHLEEAARMVTESVELGRLWGHSEVLIGGYVAQARVLAGLDDLPGADRALLEAERLVGQCTLSPGIASAVESQRVRWWLAKGEVERAFRHVQERGDGAGDAIHYLNEPDLITRARVLIAMAGENAASGSPLLQEAIALLARLEGSAREGGRVGRLIAIQLLRAVALHAGGETDRALPLLLDALHLAEPEGYVRSFIDLGSPVEQLLGLALEALRGRSSGETSLVSQLYVEGLLDAMRAEARDRRDGDPIREPSTAASGVAVAPASMRGDSGPSLVDPLSEREVEVLRLVAVGMSNAEIACRLFIAESTVKSHLNTIFGKLNVKRRTQAAALARELGLA
jgi:LuxR family transcriptional regulator, maltose regulon positive regulatory protein